MIPFDTESARKTTPFSFLSLSFSFDSKPVVFPMIGEEDDSEGDG